MKVSGTHAAECLKSATKLLITFVEKGTAEKVRATTRLTHTATTHKQEWNASTLLFYLPEEYC